MFRLPLDSSPHHRPFLPPPPCQERAEMAMNASKHSKEDQDFIDSVSTHKLMEFRAYVRPITSCVCRSELRTCRNTRPHMSHQTRGVLWITSGLMSRNCGIF